MRCLSVAECERWRKENSGRREWKRQLTCATPLPRLPWFAAEVVRHLLPFEQALLIVDQVVFGVPQALEAIRRDAGETRAVQEAPGHLFENDEQGFTRALEAALSGWIDFRVLFSPSRNALRADHDEYTTFFSTSPGKIAEVRAALMGGNIRIVEYRVGAP